MQKSGYSAGSSVGSTGSFNGSAGGTSSIASCISGIKDSVHIKSCNMACSFSGGDSRTNRSADGIGVYDVGSETDWSNSIDNRSGSVKGGDGFFGCLPSIGGSIPGCRFGFPSVGGGGSGGSSSASGGVSGVESFPGGSPSRGNSGIGNFGDVRWMEQSDLNRGCLIPVIKHATN